MFKMDLRYDTAYMLKYGKVGCAPLINLLRIANNWKDDDGKYINERARYGSRGASGKAAIFVYLALHLFDVDDHGFCRCASIDLIKDLLQIPRINIRRALAQLEKLGYICMGEPANGHFTFHVVDYKNIYLPAFKGGRGFININKSMVQELATFTNINKLRLVLRAYITLDNPNQKDDEHTLTMRTVRSWFPSYVTVKQIREMIAEAEKFVSVLRFEDMNADVQVAVSEAGNIRHQIDEDTLKNTEKLTAEFGKMETEYDGIYSEAEAHKEKYGEYPRWIAASPDEKECLSRTRTYMPEKDEILSLAKLATNHGIDIVVDAVRYVCRKINLRKDHIRSLAAYVTTLIKRHPKGYFDEAEWAY